ncbi:hypothetical protein GCM10022289_46190 [Pedobacter jeongneungensis]|uniref:Uncharacterized protein n=2 Tax=Pedobacter jeongneungensis TaxID=947309 RepID=A0ABP8BQN2_9SPHI
MLNINHKENDVEQLNAKIMSIYFQYPTIDEFQALTYPVKTEENKQEYLKDEDSLIKEQILELRDYLALKQL